MKDYKYRATCIRKCYWLDNLWEIGEVYEGDIPPNRHFSTDGKVAEPEPEDAGSDPRSNAELKRILSAAPFNFKVPSKWRRRQIWTKLKEMEAAQAKDELTNPSEETIRANFVALCGFEAKSTAGLSAHERQCDKCIELKGE